MDDLDWCGKIDRTATVLMNAVATRFVPFERQEDWSFSNTAATLPETPDVGTQPPTCVEWEKNNVAFLAKKRSGREEPADASKR